MNLNHRRFNGRKQGLGLSLAPWLAAFGCLAFVTVAAASPDAGHGEAHHGLEWFAISKDGPHGRVGFFWVLVNFGVLMWILEKLMFSKLRSGHQSRRTTIASELESATSARKAAESVLAEYEGRVARLDDEVAEIKRVTKEHAQRDGERILQQAKTDAEAIRKSALETAEREAEARRREIEAEVLDRAVEKAEQALRGAIGPADQTRLVDGFVAQLSPSQFGGPSNTGARS